MAKTPTAHTTTPLSMDSEATKTTLWKQLGEKVTATPTPPLQLTFPMSLDTAPKKSDIKEIHNNE